ncbi:MAG: WD40 repeat domain-containing protein [Candidatus Poribacteria bacterium]|nr:WD40 repeat domain-containing protein [Candidatus Poribacteria bacterium]
MKKYSRIKNRDILAVLILILFSMFYLPPLFAQSPIPEGAIEWFGKGRIYDMQYSPDGTRLAVATSLGIWIYDATTYQPLHFLKKHEYLVERIVFSPDGDLLASEERFDIHLWDVNTGKHKYKLDHRGGIKHFDFSADGQTLVTLGRGSPFISTILYHVDSGAEKQVKDMHMNDIDFIQAHHTTFDRNNNILATGELDNTIYLWDLVEGVRKKTLRRQKGYLNCLTFSPDGKTIVSASADKTIKLWDANTMTKKKVFSGDMDALTDMALRPDGKTIAAVDNTATIYLWDIETSTEKKFRIAHGAGVISVAFSSDGQRLAVGGVDGAVTILDAETGVTQQQFTGHQAQVKVVGFAAGGKVLASLSDDGVFFLWDVAATE